MKLAAMKTGQSITVKSEQSPVADPSPSVHPLEEKVTKEVHRWGLVATKGILEAIVRGLDGKGGKAVLATTKINALIELLQLGTP
jgi:hypothetical protein